MTTVAIETSALAKDYRTAPHKPPTTALRGVSVKVERGCIFGLLGQNGAGKTTLVKILLSLVTPTSGRAKVLGHDPFDLAVRRRIGFLPEQMSLPEYMKAHRFLAYMADLNGVSKGDQRKRIPELLELVGLPGEKKLLKAYSKGMLQRLGLAQALINDPDLLFLDEPTEGLDPIGRKHVRDLLMRLRAQGKTIFLNSHILSEVEMICDEMLILKKGEMVRAGKPSDFTKRTGEYRVTVATATDAAQAAAEAILGPVKWDGASLRCPVADRAQLNQLIDKLRAAGAEIESIEPLKSTLEEFFIEVATSETAAGKEA